MTYKLLGFYYFQNGDSVEMVCAAIDNGDLVVAYNNTVQRMTFAQFMSRVIGKVKSLEEVH